MRERSPAESDDPTVIRSVAVSTDDAVTAFEANLRGRRRVVLRVTPPFAPRERARLHVVTRDGASDGSVPPILVEPASLVRDPPPYPTPDDTEDELRAAGESYTPERHRERHATSVSAWRRAVRERIRSRVVLQTQTGSHEVDVKRLG